MRHILIASLFALLGLTGVARADGTKLAREAAEFLFKKFTKEAAEEGAEKLTSKLAAAAARHGDEVIDAARRIGPKALRYADELGEHAPQAMRLVSRHGDDAATLVLSRPRALALFRRYGDDGAEAILRHPGVAEGVIESAGKSALPALKAVSPQNGRRLAMLARSGELGKFGRANDLLDVVTRHGDKAMDFIWRNKGTLAVGTTLAAFLANPEPFIEGTAQLATVTVTQTARAVGDVAGKAVTPLATATGHAIEEAGHTLAGPLAILACLAGVAGIGGWLWMRWEKMRA